MLDNVSPEDVIPRLEQALTQGGLPTAVRASAESLLNRLSGGVQVFVLGPKNVGKSQLCAVMLGDRCAAKRVGAGQGCRYLCSSRMSHAFPDDLEPVSPSSALLDVITLVDIALPDTTEDVPDVVKNVFAQADMVLWCTDIFGPQEAEFWASAPDHLKDHSFLVLTKADIVAADGALPERMAALQAVAAEEFHSFFPTSTQQIFGRLSADEDVDGAQLAASGVKAMRDMLLKLATSGRRADLDSALLFLERHEVRQTAAPQASPTGSDPDNASATRTYREALELLRTRTPDLVSLDAGDDLPDQVLRTCGTLTEDLAELAAEQTQSDPVFEVWRNDIYEASDKVVLMSLENDLRSAADAATVILQLKQELEDLVGC